MTAVPDKTTPPGNRGSHFNKGSEFLYYVNETNRQVWRQPVNPATKIAQQATRGLVSGQNMNLNTIDLPDLRWLGSSTRTLSSLNGALLIKLSGFTKLDDISPTRWWR